MSYKNLNNLCWLTESPEVSSEILRETTKAIFTLSELTRLVEIRLYELENSHQAKDVADVVDGRVISVIIDNKRGESTRERGKVVITRG